MTPQQTKKETLQITVSNSRTGESKVLSAKDYEINGSVINLAKPVGDFFPINNTMTPLDTYKKGIEETEEHFENIYYGKDEFGGRNFVSEHAVKDFLDMNKQSTLALLRALREEEDILTAIDTLISNIENNE